jgi:hypothetical protein
LIISGTPLPLAAIVVSNRFIAAGDRPAVRRTDIAEPRTVDATFVDRIERIEVRKS